MNNDKTESTDTTKMGETELESVTGGATGAINLDSFITLIGQDRLRSIAGMDRPKGLYTNVRDRIAVNPALDTAVLKDAATNVRLRGV